MRTKLLLIPVLILVAGAAFQGAVPAAQPGASVTLEFSRDGLYPFFWMLHPGMVGVVVVGAGTGLGAAERSGVPAVTRAALAAPVSHPSPQPTSGPGSYLLGCHRAWRGGRRWCGVPAGAAAAERPVLESQREKPQSHFQVGEVRARRLAD